MLGVLVAQSLAEYIRDARRAAGLSQWQVANGLGTDQSYVSKLESGRYQRPEIERVYRLAEVLGAPVEELLRLAGYPVTEHTARITEDPASVDDDVPVRFYGRVPADQLRWVAMEEGGELVPAPRDIVGTRHPGECLVVEASGNCLMQRGIIDGTRVVLARHHGGRLPAGSIVLANVQGEHSLKIIHYAGGKVELRDGADNVIHSSGRDDEIRIEGVYLGHWHRG